MTKSKIGGNIKTDIRKPRTLELGVVPKIFLLIAWVGGVYLAVQYLLAFLIRLIFQPSVNTPLLQTFYAILCYAISIIVILFVPKKINKKWGANLEELGLIELPTWTDLGLAPVGFFLYVIFKSGKFKTGPKQTLTTKYMV